MSDDAVVALASAQRKSLLSLARNARQQDRARERLASGRKVATVTHDAVNFFRARTLSDRAAAFMARKQDIDQAISALQTTLHSIRALDQLLKQLKGLAVTAAAAGVEQRVAATRAFRSIGAQIVAQIDDGSWQGLNLLNNSAARLTVRLGILTQSRLVVPGRNLLQAGADGLFGSRQVGLFGPPGAAHQVPIFRHAATPLNPEAARAELSGIVLDGDRRAVMQAGIFLTQLHYVASVGAMSGGHAADAAGSAASLAAVADPGNAGGSAVYGVVVAAAARPGANSKTVLAAAMGEVKRLEQVLARKEARKAHLERLLSGDGGNVQAFALSGFDLGLKDGQGHAVGFGGFSQSALEQAGKAASMGVTAGDMGAVLVSRYLDPAIGRLRGLAQELGAGLAILQTRLRFTGDYGTGLTIGADKLTLADLNAEGARLVALRTRQRLGIQALAISGQQQEAILALLRQTGDRDG